MRLTRYTYDSPHQHVLSPSVAPCLAAGFYNPDSGSRSIASCRACEAGKANPVSGSRDASVCTDCLPGSFTNSEGKATCTPCAPGTYQNASGATACMECPVGAYCPEGAAAALPCPAGDFSNQSGLQSREGCSPCPAGTYCFVGSTAATSCSKGTYAAAEGSQLCDACPEGTYQGSEGQTTCKMCPPGRFCEAGSTTPLLCDAGTFGNASGLRGIGDCEDVPPGFYAQAGSIVPTGCPSWGFCPGRQADEVNDMPGSIPIVIPDGQQTRTQTEIVQQVVNQTVLELPLQVEVASVNMLNETAVRLHVASMLGVPLHAISLDLGASRRRLEHPGTARSRRLVALDLIVTIVGAPAVDIAGAESLWKSKSVSALSAELGVDVLNAPDPIVATKLAIRNATVSAVVVVECPPGHWGANGECVPCAKGTYRSGGTNWTGCEECVPGTYQPFLGGTECMVCGARHTRFFRPP